MTNPIGSSPSDAKVPNGTLLPLHLLKPHRRRPTQLGGVIAKRFSLHANHTKFTSQI
jgi:hypothetical protein